MKVFDFVTRRYTADEYLDACADTPCMCERGHEFCAAWPLGPCSEEILEAVEEAMKEAEQ